MTNFDYHEAFSRTLGFVTPEELERLRHARIAIAGMGGVGGIHLETLARLGIGAFHIADFDQYEIQNFNRQAGACVSTIGRPKVEVMSERALDINPQLQLTRFPNGVTPENVDSFLEGVDVYVDGLDFFAFDARAMLFAKCAEKRIPAITVAPMGMSAALVNFLPGRMTFEEYFGWRGITDPHEKALRMVVGLAPKASQRHSLVYKQAVNLKAGKSASTPMGCVLCAGVAATEALKIILKRGPVSTAPTSMVYDAYLNRRVKSWTPWGMKNPLLRLRLAIVRAVLNHTPAKADTP